MDDWLSVAFALSSGVKGFEEMPFDLPNRYQLGAEASELGAVELDEPRNGGNYLKQSQQLVFTHERTEGCGLLMLIRAW